MKKIILLFIFMLPCIIFAKTIEQLRKEANQGSIDAMVELAIAYCKGNGISQNFNIGADWFRKASNRGCKEAQFTLALMYLDGIGVPHDPVESARLLRSASDKGFAAAQFNLGFLYEYGIGVTRNLKQAEYYYQLAANQGYTKAIYRLEIVKTRRGNSIKASQQYATTTTPSRQELNPSIKLESKEEHIRRGIITREKCEKAFVTHMKRKGINCQPKYMLDCDYDPKSPVYFYGDFYVGTFDVYYVEFFLEENNEITWKTKQLKW